MEIQQDNREIVVSKKLSFFRVLPAVFLFSLSYCAFYGFFLFLKSLDTFSFDDTRPYYTWHFWIVSVFVLFVIPSFILFRTYKKNKIIFRIHFFAWLLMLCFGLSISFVNVKSDWLEFCSRGWADPNFVSFPFHRDYCKTHSLSAFIFLKRSVADFMGIGGVEAYTRFADAHGVFADITSFVEEAKKAELSYVKNYPVSLTLGCRYVFDKSVYNKNISVDKGTDVMGNGLFTISTQVDSSNGDILTICKDILPKIKAQVFNPDGFGYGGCTYNYPEIVRTFPYYVVFSSDINPEYVVCLKSLEIDTNDAKFQSYHLDGLSREYFDVLGIKQNVFNSE